MRGQGNRWSPQRSAIFMPDNVLFRANRFAPLGIADRCRAGRSECAWRGDTLGSVISTTHHRAVLAAADPSPTPCGSSLVRAGEVGYIDFR